MGTAEPEEGTVPIPVFLNIVFEYMLKTNTHQMNAKRIRDVCRACGKADGTVGGGRRVWLRACDACDAVRYCGRDCQRADWTVHRLVCKILAADREIMVG